MMLRRRSKTPNKRKPLLDDCGGTPQTASDETEDEDGTMVLQVPLPSTTYENAPQRSSRRHRARSLTRSRSPFWRRRKQTQEYAAYVYNHQTTTPQPPDQGIGTRTCGDIFRNSCRTNPSPYEVDYMQRQLSSEYSFVEVILGDYKNKVKQSPISGQRQGPQAADIPIQVQARQRSTRVSPSRPNDPPVKTSPARDDAIPAAPVSPAENTLPVAAIEVKRRRSDFVSELSEPQVIPKETVTSVRKALIKAQRRLAGASRWGRKVSPEILLKAFMEVAESLESKQDREILRREMERILAESMSPQSSIAASDTEESTDNESYVPVGMCQFPGAPVVVDEDLSETSSFKDWLGQTEEKRGKWKSTFDVFNLSNLWSDKLSAEWDHFLQDTDDDDESEVPFQPIESPPELKRISATSKGFFPRRNVEATKAVTTPKRTMARQRSSLPPAERESRRQRSIEPRNAKQWGPDINRTKTSSMQKSEKTLLTSFPSDVFANEDWMEQEAQRILRNKSLQRIRSEKEKRRVEEQELKKRVSETVTDKPKSGQLHMIEQRVLDQFETPKRPIVTTDTPPKHRSRSRQGTSSLQRSVPGQSLRMPEPVNIASGYQIYKPAIFPKFAATNDDDAMSLGSIQTNSFDDHDEAPKEAAPTPKAQPQNSNLPYTQRLLARKREQQSHRQQRRSKSVEHPKRGTGHRLVSPRQLV